MPTMIPVRLAKLKFLVEEMQLTFFLTEHVTDSFAARSLARHILVRAENFIEHARSLRKPLKSAGYDTQEFHRLKETYASEFEEYFKLARHKLGAHVQDFDFGKRIELWNEIEIIKIRYFVEGAREIYRSLAPLSLPDYIAYADPPELSEPAVVENLRQFQRAIDARNWVEMGTDPLAMTRNNTSAVLNTTLVHQRAGQLALIRRWIAMHRDLLGRFAANRGIARILRARIITDIVSFCDCLVTRPVSPAAPQALDGLDKLITAEGLSSGPIDNFVMVSNFQAVLLSARVIRDTVGAHLEIDDGHPIASLAANLDAYDLDHGLDFYARVASAFMKTCHSIIFLRMYAADGQRLYGVSASRAPATPYAGSAPSLPPALPDPPPINDDEAYRTNLTRWLDGDDAQKGDARHFFWHAFAASEIVEVIEDVESFGSGYHSFRYEFRKAHQFLSEILTDELSDYDFEAVLELILSCRGGWPYPLAELLVRYGRHASVFRQRIICRAIGEIGSAPHTSVWDFLEERARSASWPIRLEAAIARFKTFVKDEGVFRINHRGQTKQDYAAFEDSLITQMSESELLVCRLAFASIMSGPNIGSFAQPFQSDYTANQIQIEMLCLPFLKDNDNKSKATTLRQLIQTHDYVGVCVLVALDLDGGERHPLHSALLDNCCNGSIVTAGHDQAARHLAMCFLLKKQLETAYEIAAGLASRNPEWLDVQILAAEILADTPGAEVEAAQRIGKIRRAYNLTGNFAARVTAAETEIANRGSSR